MDPFAIWWCRRDIRPEDNHALYQALRSGLPVQPVFIFDTDILDDLKESSVLSIDKRVEFIHNELISLHEKLLKYGSSLWVFYGKPIAIWKKISSDLSALKAVYTNRDYEPYAISRDKQVEKLLASKDIEFHTFKDQCIFEYKEVLKDDESPYTVFTPYSRKWLSKFNAAIYKAFPSEKLLDALKKDSESYPIPSLSEMGFIDSRTVFPEKNIADHFIRDYGKTRDFPGASGTSKLGIHLRFGIISIRQLAKQAFENGGTTFLNELIWRDFYMMILAHFPQVINNSFKPDYDKVEWRNDREEFEKWCNGMTGYPLVDAGMRELNATGFMHNRVRMVTASFLTKHLLIDWRWGEAYFAKKLLDYELSSNNGGWQWSAGTGSDSAPYFRIFNPTTQAKKFDPKLNYIKKWVPELDSFDYPQPIVEHTFARARVLEVYGKALRY